MNRSPLDELFVKFNAVVGRSILHSSVGFVDLGIVKKLDEVVTGYFTLSNRTTELPLDYKIIAPKEGNVEVLICYVMMTSHPL